MKQKFPLRKLLKIYREYVNFSLEEQSKTIRFSLGVKELKLKEKTIKKFVSIYNVPTFVEFYTRLRDIIFSNNIFEIVEEGRLDNWYMWYLVSFLLDKNYAILSKKGKLEFKLKWIEDLLVKKRTFNEIKMKIQDLLKIPIEKYLRLPSIELLKQIRTNGFRFKPYYDQWPISLESTMTLISKILEHYPFKSKFIFLGDDDFVSIYLSMVEDEFSSIVIDIDNELLETIDFFSNHFNFNIKTKRMNVLKKGKKEKLDDLVLGFSTNPPYTLEGVTSFIKCGLNFFNKYGGRIFLGLGDEIMGTRYLLMQKFFTKNGLIIREVVRGAIHYPFMIFHENDKRIFEKMKKFIDEEVIKSHYQINGDIWILDYIPWKVKLIKLKGMKIYSYI